MNANAPSLTRTPLIQRLAAIGLLLILVGIALASLAGPMIEAAAARIDAAERLARFEAVLAEPSLQQWQYDPNELAAVRQDDGEAQIALQSITDRLLREAGVTVRSVRPLQAESFGSSGRTVWLEASLAGDIQSLVELLNAMDAQRPTLLVRRLDVISEPPGGGRNLQVRIEAGQAWRAGDGAQ